MTLTKLHPVDRAHKETASAIIQMLETDGLRWTKRWSSPSASMNAVSGHVYRGSNVITTGIALMVIGQSDPRFLTFAQAIALGGAVRKGEKSFPIIAYNAGERETEGGETKRFSYGKVYRMFHVSQCDGLDEARLAPLAPPPDPTPRVRNARIEALIASYCVATGVTVESAQSAFYTRDLDKIGIPPIEQFLPGEGATAEEHYYSTMLHEMVHSTGVEKRIGRECYLKYHGHKQERAREELVAEIGSVMLGQALGLQAEPREDNAAYVKSWVQLLTDQPRAIFDAAAKAQAAADFIQSPPAKERQAA